MDIVKFFDDFFKKGAATEKVEAPAQQPPTKPEKPSYFNRLMMAESSGKADAKAATSSAVGHYQYVEGTWKYLTKKYDKPYTLEDRKDPQKALEIVQLHTDENSKQLQKTLGRDPTETELYAAHFLGTSGAKKFLKASPFEKATKVVSKDQAERNKNIFFDNKTKRERTVAEVYEILKNKIGEE